MFVCLAALEFGFRVYEHLFSDEESSLTALLPELTVRSAEWDYLYRMKASIDYPMLKTNSRGLRDIEHSYEADEDAFRILFLGDSVAFGSGLPDRFLFTNYLRKKFGNSGICEKTKDVEIINCSVPAYTIYNELHYFLQEGVRYSPKIAILCICLNDVAAPALHWIGLADRIPPGAVPDPSRHRWNLIKAYFLTRSHLFRWGYFRIVNTWRKSLDPPAHLTGKDFIKIDVYLDKNSPQWIWFRDKLNSFIDEANKRNIKPIVCVFPLSYQMTQPPDAVQPQDAIMQACREKKTLCLDMREALQGPLSSIYFLNDDIWHLSPPGHRATAEYLYKILSSLVCPDSEKPVL